MKSTSIGLAVLALPLMVTYFYLFARTIRGLSTDDQRRYAGQRGKARNVAVVALGVVSLFILETPLARLGTVLALVAWGIWATVQHDRQLEANFPPEFRQRLLRVSLLGGAAFLLALPIVVVR